MSNIEESEDLLMIKQENGLLSEIARYLVQEKIIEPEEQVRFLQLLEE